MKNGYVYHDDAEEFTCLICGEGFINGMIYPKDDKLMDAKKHGEPYIRQARFGF